MCGSLLSTLAVGDDRRTGADVSVPVLPLTDAMAHLAHSSTPPLWQAAVGRAGRLLVPSWRADPDFDALSALTLLLYHLAHHTGREVDAVPLKEVGEALAEPNLDAPGGIKDAMWTGLVVAGHPFPPDDAVRRVARRVLPMSQPDAGSLSEGSERPGRSPLACCARVLRARLAAVDELPLPQLPWPVGPLAVRVTGPVRLVGTNMTQLVKCERCGQYTGGTLLIDGDVAAYRCRRGHTVIEPSLGAAHARRALHSTVPRRGRVRGTLLVAVNVLPPQTDPHTVCVFFPQGLPPTGWRRVAGWPHRVFGRLEIELWLLQLTPSKYRHKAKGKS